MRIAARCFAFAVLLACAPPLPADENVDDASRIPFADAAKKEWLSKQKRLWQLTRPEVEDLLKEVHRRFPDPSERFRAIHTLRVGTPYAIFCAGEESPVDPDPVFRIDTTDCVLSVMTTIGMTESPDLDLARELMGPLMYYPDPKDSSKYPFDFFNRIHDTWDWGTKSPYYRDISAKVAGDKILKRKTKVWGPGVQTYETTVSTVPTSLLTPEFMARLPKLVVIGLCPDGTYASHVGVILDGKLFVHATTMVCSRLIIQGAFPALTRKNSRGKPRTESLMMFEIQWKKTPRPPQPVGAASAAPSGEPAKLASMAATAKTEGKVWEEYAVLRDLTDRFPRASESAAAVKRIHELEDDPAAGPAVVEGRKARHRTELLERAKTCEASAAQGNRLGIGHAKVVYRELITKFPDSDEAKEAGARLKAMN